MDFGQFLKSTRKELGYSSATKFYEFISSRREPSFNYSYYTRIESGQSFPSKTFVNELANILPTEQGKNLIMIWCQITFPLFKEVFATKNPLKKTQKQPSKESSPQKYLSGLQVNTVTGSFQHYQLFILLTLSRGKLLKSDLINMFDFDAETILNKFIEVNIAHQEGDYVYQKSHDLRFPKPDTPELKKIFTTVQGWNKELKMMESFSPIKNKFFIRRTSTQCLDYLISSLNQIDEFLRVAEEVTDGLNHEVIILEYSLTNGHLPG